MSAQLPLLVPRRDVLADARAVAAPAGNVQRAVKCLVEWGVVRPRSCRWPTEAGIALVDEMGRVS